MTNIAKRITAYGRALAKQFAHRAVRLLELAEDFSLPSELPLRTKLAFLLGNYEHETTEYIRTHVRGGVAVDVGAHVGVYARLLATLADTVYAFEPDPTNFALLVKNTRRYPNVVPVPLAVSDTSGEAILSVTPGSTFRHSLARNEPGASALSVHTTTLDDYLAGDKRRVSFVKIDVEGHEDKVLAGMQKRRKQDQPLIIAEMPLNDTYQAVSPAIGREGLVRNYVL